MLQPVESWLKAIRHTHISRITPCFPTDSMTESPSQSRFLAGWAIHKALLKPVRLAVAVESRTLFLPSLRPKLWPTTAVFQPHPGSFQDTISGLFLKIDLLRPGDDVCRQSLGQLFFRAKSRTYDHFQHSILFFQIKKSFWIIWPQRGGAGQPPNKSPQPQQFKDVLLWL